MSAIFFSPKQVSSPAVVFNIQTENYNLSSTAVKRTKAATHAVMQNMSPFTPINTLRSNAKPDTPRPKSKYTSSLEIKPISFDLTPFK